MAKCGSHTFIISLVCYCYTKFEIMRYLECIYQILSSVWWIFVWCLAGSNGNFNGIERVCISNAYEFPNHLLDFYQMSEIDRTLAVWELSANGCGEYMLQNFRSYARLTVAVLVGSRIRLHTYTQQYSRAWCD